MKTIVCIALSVTMFGCSVAVEPGGSMRPSVDAGPAPAMDAGTSMVPQDAGQYLFPPAVPQAPDLNCPHTWVTLDGPPCQDLGNGHWLCTTDAYGTLASLPQDEDGGALACVSLDDVLVPECHVFLDCHHITVTVMEPDAG